MPALSIEHLSKSFGDTPVLTDVSLEAASGEFLVVLGPSGCGKSTLLRLIAGLETVDSGRILLDNQDITHFEPQARKTAMVFQNYALYPHMTVFENIAFPLKMAKASKDEIRQSVLETADLLELGSLLDRRPAELSGGQRQRVALGRGLIRKPSIFLLDEPLSNLDAALRMKMRQEIVALQRRVGVTMIYVTHDQVEALTMADSMVVLEGGRIRQRGTPREVYGKPVDSFVASFIGSPPINLFDDTITNGVGTVLPVIFGREVADGAYTVGIRPEHITIDAAGPLTGEITAIEYIGAVSYLRLRTDYVNLTVTVDSAGSRFRVGQRVATSIDPSRVYLFRK